MIYLISYDLSITARPDDYQRLEAALRLLGGRRVLQTQWTLVSDKHAHALEGYLRGLMGPDDRLLVAQITPNSARSNLLNDVDRLPVSKPAAPGPTPRLF